MKNDICTRQSSEDGVKIAAAFRYAYSQAKFWKSWIWALSAILVILQLLVTINHAHLEAYLPSDLAAIVVVVSLTSMLMATLGRHLLINSNIELGSNLQRLHDHQILGLGIKPTILEVSQSQINRLSNKWLSKKPQDYSNISKWWPDSVAELPEKAGIVLCLFSTFRWESELRKKYSIVLLTLGAILLAGSLYLMHILDYQIADYIVKIFTPAAPLFALMIDELLLNRSCLKVAKNASQRTLGLWSKTLDLSECDMVLDELDQLSFLWAQYRSSASPIFDWLYWLTQKTMNEDMVVDASALVSEFKATRAIV
jgi:hypothetical protein